MISRGNSTKHFLRSFIFAFVMCVVATLFLFGFLKASMQDYVVRKEIKALEHEKAQLSQNKLNLLERLQDAKSDSFVEKEARLKFGLQKPGESVILFNTGDTGPEEGKTTSTTKDTTSNAGDWRRYFFHIN
ncbi:MAG: Septum formation initiator [Candidatus Magasanikbacteria bacterium GW2011_GWA2_45_39]|uniref:Septum formation initiator n=2 Tax=Candidatus Magasanikiibacteriota TaxID=1752731 RepID=A0A0G1N147_9BACT|nr:MAG: Septum formation initiator [Candidatus Magasanikbacteria bacterium GW2011_GWA2_45_39]KKU14204.1 MAG: Septum formation initiator [Candidatus Magasanikbacteria bacterium GW2011_GWC2_45_8]